MRGKVFSITFGLLCLPATLGLAQAPEVLVGTGEFPPFTTDTTADQGCVIKIVRSAYEAEGWALMLKFLPWSRNLTMLSRGQIDASAYWMDRPDRREEYVFSKNPVTSEVYRFVFRQDAKVDWDTLEDLAGKTIILNKDYTYTDAFQNALEEFGINRHEVPSQDLNLKMILKGRGDLTILSEKVYQKYFDALTEEQQEELFIDTKPALANMGYLVFSRENVEQSQKLAQVFDDGYEKIRDQTNLKPHFETCGL